MPDRTQAVTAEMERALRAILRAKAPVDGNWTGLLNRIQQIAENALAARPSDAQPNAALTDKLAREIEAGDPVGRTKGAPAKLYGAVGVALFNADLAALPIDQRINAVGNAAYAALAARPQASDVPIPMLLFCPKCGLQHVDEPDERTPDWDNPPHRSHLCHGCGCIWRPADVPTNGVAAIETAGKADTWFAAMGSIAASDVEQAAASISERASDHIYSAFDWDEVPDSAWEELTVRLADIATEEIAAMGSTSEMEEMRRALENARHFLTSTNQESGWCCCGDTIAAHGIGSGHSPVDAQSHYAAQIVKQIDTALTRNGQ